MRKHRNGKIIINIIFCAILIISFYCFFSYLHESILWSEEHDDIFGSVGTTLILVLCWGPMFVIGYGIYRFIRLLAFSEKVLSKSVKYVRDGVIFVVLFGLFLCGMMCRSIYGNQPYYFRIQFYYELLIGMIIILVPAYLLGFILSKIIKLLPIGEKNNNENQEN